MRKRRCESFVVEVGAPSTEDRVIANYTTDFDYELGLRLQFTLTWTLHDGNAPSQILNGMEKQELGCEGNKSVGDAQGDKVKRSFEGGESYERKEKGHCYIVWRIWLICSLMITRALWFALLCFMLLLSDSYL